MTAESMCNLYFHCRKVWKHEEKRGVCDLFWSVLQRKEIHFIFTDNVIYIVFILQCQTVQIVPGEQIKLKHRSHRFPWYPLSLISVILLPSPTVSFTWICYLNTSLCTLHQKSKIVLHTFIVQQM